MTKLIFVRHAEHDYLNNGRLAGRLPGIHLNDNGKEQAEKVGQFLSGYPIKAVYSSPLERTLETAQCIASKLDLSVIFRDSLLEIDYGEWQGQELATLKEQSAWEKIMCAPSTFIFPGGESFLSAQKRIADEMNLLISQYQKNDMIVVVSHSDPIKLALCSLLDLNLEAIHRFTISPASITCVKSEEKKNTLLNANIVCASGKEKLF